MARHPFADRWNHNTHYYPLIRAQLGSAPRSVLDIGCGEGTLVRFLIEGGHRAVGLDVDRSGLAADGGDWPRVAGSAVNLPLEDGSVDAVTMVMTLHHVDPLRALSEVRRVLKPGGGLVLLGYGWSASLRDSWDEAADTATHRVVSGRMRSWEPDTDKAEPDLSWGQIRELLGRELPGCSYRRLRMWRYLATWTRPTLG